MGKRIIFLVLALCSFRVQCFAMLPGFCIANTSEPEGSPRTGVAYWWTANAATDSGDYGTAPTIYGTVDYATGQVGNAAQFNTSGSDYIAVPSGVLSGADGRVGFWFKWDSTIEPSGHIFRITDGAKYLRAAMSSATTAIHASYYDGTTTRIAYGTADQIAVDTWYFFELKWTYSGGSVTLYTYLNGVQHGTTTGSMSGSVISDSVVGEFGKLAGSNAYTINLDNIIVATSSAIDLNAMKNYTGAYE